MDDLIKNWLICLSILGGFQCIFSIIQMFSNRNTLNTKADFHLTRRFQHCFSGVILICMIHLINDTTTSTIFCCGAVVLLLTFEIMRRLSNNFKYVFLKVLGPILRKEEMESRPVGSLFF